MIGVEGGAGRADRARVPEEECTAGGAGEEVTPERTAKEEINENCSCFIRRNEYIVALRA
jgi:hypothetical protein